MFKNNVFPQTINNSRQEGDQTLAAQKEASPAQIQNN